MKSFLLFLIFSVSSYASEPCKIETYAKIVKINKVLDDTIIKNTNCSKELSNHFITLINNANGKLRSSYINEYFKNYENSGVTLKPSSIEVLVLKDLIHKKYGSENLIVSNVSSLLGKSSLNLDISDQLKFNCSNCNTPGSKNIKLILPNKERWIGIQMHSMSRAYRLTKSLSSMTPLLVASDFEEIQTVHQGNYKVFNNIENIQFYKLNKHLNSGEILKVNDLYPKTLINFGQRVKLTIINKNIQLKGVGVAKRNGKIGEYIEIENPKTKKIFLGKVTNFNEAIVEL